ncbi:MAG: hypothetical protein ACHQT7_00565 [Candidatus Levyibacteriota bacterium]
MQKIGTILDKFNPAVDKYVSREFQSFGLYMAEELHDYKHRSLYIKLAKTTNRALIEKAMSYVKDATTTTPNKGALFMWKLKQLKDEEKGIKPPKSKYDK